jgi:hypothetical protein
VFKRNLLSVIFLLAYSISVGHSIIPHHHHKSSHNVSQAAGHDHDHDGNKQDDDNFLSHNFTNYLHSGSQEDLQLPPSSKISADQVVCACSVALFQFHILDFESPPPIPRHCNDFVLLSEYDLSNKGLRAPPCLV